LVIAYWFYFRFDGWLTFFSRPYLHVSFVEGPTFAPGRISVFQEPRGDRMGMGLGKSSFLHRIFHGSLHQGQHKALPDVLLPSVFCTRLQPGKTGRWSPPLRPWVLSILSSFPLLCSSVYI
jgi:hypothetical protein